MEAPRPLDVRKGRAAKRRTVGAVPEANFLRMEVNLENWTQINTG